MKCPYVIYADTESIIEPTTTPTTNSTTQSSEHVPCSFFYIVVRSDGEVTNMSLYCGEDCMDVFFQQLDRELEKIRNDLNPFTATGYFDIPPPRWPTFLVTFFRF